MPLAITEEHRALTDVVRSFAAANELRTAARSALNTPGAYRPDDWAKIAAQGWLGLHIAEEYGGSGFGLAETAVVADELGYVISPAPFLPSVIASTVLGALGSKRQREDYLPGLAQGTVLAGVALWGGALTRGSDGRLSGTLNGLVSGADATLLLVVLGADLVVIAADAPGVTVTPASSLDPSLGFGTVSLDAVAADADAVIPAGAEAAIRALRTIAAAEAAGGARAMLDLALEYAKVREQFGRTIGSFQAIKHQLADMLVRTELATALSWDAARAADAVTAGLAPDEQATLAAGAAALVAAPAYQQNAQRCIQVLGGIGFTWEHDAHLYLRRAVSLGNLLAADDAGPVVYALTDQGVVREYGVDLPPEAEQYRQQAQEFLARYESTDPAAQRALWADSGYLVPHWPPPFGLGAGPVQQLVIDEELSTIEHPDLGITAWVLLTLTQTATAEQIARWVPSGLAGDDIWCQLFSEPGAGSDAAAVRTRGVKVEGGWRVNGQKVWTSGAQRCSRGLATIRTDVDAPKHKGITAMVIDMHAPGVEVRPLRQITGGSDFNEVFFDDVFVPDSDVVGEVNDGWRVARATLGNERVSIGGGLPGRFTPSRLIQLAQRFGGDDSTVRADIAYLSAEDQALQLVNLRQVARAVAGSGPGPEGNVTKLAGAEHTQRLTELAVRVVGIAALTGEDTEASLAYLGNRSQTIAGGTSEITRNVIAERILGLPRDPLNR